MTSELDAIISPGERFIPAGLESFKYPKGAENFCQSALTKRFDRSMPDIKKIVKG